MIDEDDKVEETEAAADTTEAPESETKAEKPKAKPKRKPAAKKKPAEDEAPAEVKAEDEVPAEDEAPAKEAAPAKAEKVSTAKAEKVKTDKAPAPAATRRKRDAPDVIPPTQPPLVRAEAKYVRTSARKARLVCDHIRGKDVVEARAILAHASRDVARDWSKLLESAVANAEHNHELIGEDLRISAVKADEGPTLKRFRPRAMGRATPIRKRTSHLSITLTPKDGDN